MRQSALPVPDGHAISASPIGDGGSLHSGQVDVEIPFNRPTIEGREIEHILEAISIGHSSAKGPFARQVCDHLKAELGSAEILLTTSCTGALEMAAMLLDLGPDDTVVVPSFTFVTSALAFARQGARLLFADIEPDTLGIDPAHVADLLDPSVRAVIAVHYAGVACDLTGLERVLSSSPDVDLIEDNAHGLFGRYQDRALGTFGRFGALSFHETKNFVCGEGGALLVNEEHDVARAHVAYDKGTNREQFLHNRVDKYTWVDLGSSFGLSDLLAAYLLGQLERSEQILQKRQRVYERYDAGLGPQAARLGYSTPRVPPHRKPSYHMYYVLTESLAQRDRVLAQLRAQGILGAFHYVPLHRSPGAVPHLARRTECPVSDDVSSRLLRLPFYNSLTDAEVDRVIEAFLDALERA